MGMGSSDPFYIVIYKIKWVTTSWTDSSPDLEIPDAGLDVEAARPLVPLQTQLCCSHLFFYSVFLIEKEIQVDRKRQKMARE